MRAEVRAEVRADLPLSTKLEVAGLDGQVRCTEHPGKARPGSLALYGKIKLTKSEVHAVIFYHILANT